MVYPSQETRAKNAIFGYLRRHDSYSIETGVGYNELFEKLRRDIGSRATFDKYLKNLVAGGVLERKPNPKHKSGVIFYLNKEALELEELVLDFADKLRGTLQYCGLKPVEYELPQIRKLSPESQKKIKMVTNCLALTHETLLRMLPESRLFLGEDSYIGVVKIGGKYQIQFQPRKVSQTKNRCHAVIFLWVSTLGYSVVDLVSTASENALFGAKIMPLRSGIPQNMAE